jgi:hypothetical protein
LPHGGEERGIPEELIEISGADNLAAIEEIDGIEHLEEMKPMDGGDDGFRRIG